MTLGRKLKGKNSSISHANHSRRNGATNTQNLREKQVVGNGLTKEWLTWASYNILTSRYLSSAVNISFGIYDVYLQIVKHHKDNGKIWFYPKKKPIGMEKVHWQFDNLHLLEVSRPRRLKDVYLGYTVSSTKYYKTFQVQLSTGPRKTKSD